MAGGPAAYTSYAREIAEVLDHGLVHEAAPSAPLGPGLGQHRHIAHAARARARAALRAPPARTGRARCALPNTAAMSRSIPLPITCRMMLSRGAMPVPPPTSSMGAVPARYPNCPRGPSMLMQCAARRMSEQRLGELASGHPPHMQFQQPRVLRRRCNGKAAAPAARQHDVDVLPRLEAKRLPPQAV